MTTTTFSTTWDLYEAARLYTRDPDNAEAKHGPIGTWRFPSITVIDELFAFHGCKPDENPQGFDPDLSGWEVDHVVSAKYLFKGCCRFQGRGLETWRMPQLVYGDGMFLDCYNFRGDLSSLGTQQLTTAFEMFKHCALFNCSINGWAVANLKKANCMFAGCEAFNSPLGRWNVSQLKWMTNMFDGATAFRGKGLDHWKTPSLHDMSFAFRYCENFDADLRGWDFRDLRKPSEVIQGASRGLFNAFDGCDRFTWRIPVYLGSLLSPNDAHAWREWMIAHESERWRDDQRKLVADLVKRAIAAVVAQRRFERVHDTPQNPTKWKKRKAPTRPSDEAIEEGQRMVRARAAAAASAAAGVKRERGESSTAAAVVDDIIKRPRRSASA